MENTQACPWHRVKTQYGVLRKNWKVRFPPFTIRDSAGRCERLVPALRCASHWSWGAEAGGASGACSRVSRGIATAPAQIGGHWSRRGTEFGGKHPPQGGRS